MIKENQKKETKLLEHRFIELSRIAFEREIVTYSDFLNLNDQNILHTLPKDKLYSRYVLFGGYDMAERQIHLHVFFHPDCSCLLHLEFLFSNRSLMHQRPMNIKSTPAGTSMQAKRNVIGSLSPLNL